MLLDKPQRPYSSFSKSSANNETVKSIEERILPDNYIYISHLDESWCDQDLKKKYADWARMPNFWRLPCYPDEISDSMQSTFQDTSALGRSAPVYTFSHSGPRQVQISITLHRDIMDDLNAGVSNVDLSPNEDYIDALIKALQSIALPRYNLSNKAVEPPLVALRLADEVFIKGVVTSGIGLTYEKPILSNNKYARVKLSITVAEVDPYDAETVFKNGAFRGVVSTLKKDMGIED